MQTKNAGATTYKNFLQFKQKRLAKNTGEDFLDQIKDKDIFEQFDFLKAEPKVSDGAGDWGEPDPMLIDFSVEEIFEQFDFLQSSNNFNSATDDWGEQIDFSVEEILDMPTVCEVQMNPTKKGSVADSDLQSEGDYLAMDSETVLPNSVKQVNSVQMDANEQFSQKSSTTDDLDLIDIESLFDEDTDDRPVLSQEEAWELFA